MDLHLPENLQQFVSDQVREGRFPSEQQVVEQAIERYMLSQRSSPEADAVSDPWLGSMRDDADLLDEIVEEAMTIREERPWRLPSVE